MGQSLSAPITEKVSETNGNEFLKYTIATMQGWRLTMEDSHCCVIPFLNNKPRWGYFAIFDGHAGTQASQYCADFLRQKIIEMFDKVNANPEKPVNLDEYIGLNENLPSEVYNLAIAVHDAFIIFDDEMRNDPKFSAEPLSCGTTALVLIVTDDYYIFANCGDSRAVLCRDYKVFFQTIDHKPSLDHENARINKAGGHVYINRVNGNLAVSRALGDYSFKSNPNIKSTEQTVSPEPTVSIISRQKTDQFIILACDGVWDVLSNERACAFVLQCMETTDDLSKIALSLLDVCLYKDSRDNMTCLILRLDGAPNINEQKKANDLQLEERIMKRAKQIVHENESEISSYSLLRQLSNELSDVDESPLIVSLLDEAYPERDKSKSLPSTLQLLKNVVAGCNVADSDSTEDV